MIEKSRSVLEWMAAIRRATAGYVHYHGRLPRWFRPRRYTEKILWRKLFDLNPSFPVLADKLAVRDYIAARVGVDYLIPLLWVGRASDDIPFDRFEPPYVIKSNHASGHVILIDAHETVDQSAIRATAAAWLSTCYGTASDEIGYVSVPRRLMIERQIAAAGGGRPPERRLFVFHGKVRIINTVVVEDGRVRHGAFHDPSWQRVYWYFTRQPLADPFPRPERLDDMIRIAEILGAGFDHVRVDFYDCGSRIYVGELTLYSWAGHVAFNPDEADFIMGSWWHIRFPMLRALMTVLTRRRHIPAPADVNSIRRFAEPAE